MKPSLSFYTNIPSPYNSNLFEALSKYFNLTVIYYAKIESGRQWELNINHPEYNHILLEDNMIGRIIQKYIAEFHFSSKIFFQIYNDNCSYVIISGNYFSFNTYIVLIIAKLKGKNLYWFGEKLLPTRNKLKKRIKSLFLKPIFKNCKSIFCIGNEAIKSYKDYGYNGPCFNTPYSINSSVFNKNNLENEIFENFRLKLNPGNEIIILTSGSLIKRKGIDIAIESFLRLSKLYDKNISLWILGDGPEKIELERLARGSEKIFFHGFIQPRDLPYYFNLAKIFLFCSRYDGWAVVVNEALASGLPIVVSNNVSASELIKDEINGYVCESENIDLFVDSLLNILNSDNLRLNMSEQNYNLSNSISSEKIAKIIYNQIIKNV